MTRYECLQILAGKLSGDELAVVALGGMIDEWYSLLRIHHSSLYLKIMGSITPVAFGLADSMKHRRVLSLDTDGSLLLNLGILCTLGNEQPKNLITVVMDNECYEVIASPPTHTYKNVDLAAMARGAGIETAVLVRTPAEFEREITLALESDQQGFIVAKLKRGTEIFPEEKRKRTDGHEDKYNFVRYVEDSESITIIPREVKSVRKVEGPVGWES
ncbi:MAG TPA: thiamine pyrophosphate-binding protein [bacterium]|nr:thiamine pyrophosphate-binding protein [bacterium]